MVKLIAARQALIQAFGFGWGAPDLTAFDLLTTIQCSPRGNISKIADATMLSVIIGTVEKQDLVCKSWLKLAYGAWDQTGIEGARYRQNVSDWLQTGFWQRYNMMVDKKVFRMPSPEKREFISKMIIPAITDQLYRSSTSEKYYTTGALLDLLDANQVQRKHWARDWVPYWDMLLKQLDQLDGHALGPVAGMVKVINEKLTRLHKALDLIGEQRVPFSHRRKFPLANINT